MQQYYFLTKQVCAEVTAPRIYFWTKVQKNKKCIPVLDNIVALFPCDCQEF